MSAKAWKCARCRATVPGDYCCPNCGSNLEILWETAASLEEEKLRKQMDVLAEAMKRSPLLKKLNEGGRPRITEHKPDAE